MSDASCLQLQEDDGEVEWATDTSAAAIAARAAEQLSGATSEMVTQGNIEVCIRSQVYLVKSLSRQPLHRYHTAGLVQCLSRTISGATVEL
jgi:polysaccharide pyruvyl transferase WcaK-like protein